MTQMILEMLAHKTSPPCIPANILTITSLVFLEIKVVEELPSVSFVRKCRNALVVETKTLGAYLIAKSDHAVEHHTNGTKRRQVSVDNSIV